MSNIHLGMGKLPPQAIDVEQFILGSCLVYEDSRNIVAYLEPEHFYKEAHQLVFKAIKSVERCSIITVVEKLRTEACIEDCGGPYGVSTLTQNAVIPEQLDFYGRILQQYWIKRELITISSKMIQQAYNPGTDPLELFDDFLEQISVIEQTFSPETSITQIVSSYDNEKEVMDAARNNTLKMGLTTGFAELDNFFRFKPGSFVICNGHDNVGKTAILVFMAVVSNRLHGWKWILACMENNEAHIRMETIQFVTGKAISRLTDQEYKDWYAWSIENFTILKIPSQITAHRLLRIAQKLQDKKKHQGFLVDPYNALDLDIEKSKLSSHEYHYRVTGMMRNWIRKNECCIYLNTHAVTEALRRTHKDGDYAGFAMPPEKADTEGGGKFSNRADDFLTFHRYAQHPHEFNVTHIHVRKIKNTQTGGRQTIKGEPIKLKMIKGYFGFFDDLAYSPIINISLAGQFPVKEITAKQDDETPF